MAPKEADAHEGMSTSLCKSSYRKLSRFFFFFLKKMYIVNNQIIPQLPERFGSESCECVSAVHVCVHEYLLPSPLSHTHENYYS